MNAITMPYHPKPAVIAALGLVFVALGGAAVPLAMRGHLAAAILCALAALGGLACSVILATRARQVEVGLSSVTVPAGLFATHEVTIPFRHIQSTLSERGRGGLQLTILHRGRTTIVPAACLPKPHGLAELRDLILQRTAQIGRGETPHLRVNSRSAAATPRAQMPATFGRRRDAMAGRAR